MNKTNITVICALCSVLCTVCDVRATTSANMNTCATNSYTITFDCGDGTGSASGMNQTVTRVTSNFYTSATSDTGYQCNAPSGKVFNGWRMGSSNVIYDGEIGATTWTVPPETDFHATWINVASVGSLNPEIRSDRFAARDDTSPKTWSVAFPYGGVSGQAICNPIAPAFAIIGYTPDSTEQTAINIAINADDGTGEYCYCKMTAPASGPWVFLETTSASDCASWCAYDCAYYIGPGDGDTHTGFRAAVLSSD